MTQSMRNPYAILTAILFPIMVGCGDSNKQGEAKTNPAGKNGGDAGNVEDANAGTEEKNQDGAKAVEAMTLRLAGKWEGGGAIVDEKALRRYAEKEVDSKGDPADSAKRAEAIEELVTSFGDLYKEMTHVLVVNDDGTYTKTSWGTGAYSDGKPQKGTWRMTEATDGKAHIILTISGRDVPYVADFSSDGELVLQVSESMPRYSDINRAIGERYKKSSTP